MAGRHHRKLLCVIATYYETELRISVHTCVTPTFGHAHLLYETAPEISVMPKYGVYRAPVRRASSY